MGPTISLGRVLGIPLWISYTWFIILGLVIFLSRGFFKDAHPEWSVPEQWIVAGATSLLFFLSILLHELSHSVLAVRKGIPVRGITLFLFGGMSQIAREAHRPFLEFIIAAVGPISSLILGALFAGLALLLWNVNDHIASMSSSLAFINVSLGIFNLLPGFPLDGGRVLRSIIWGVTGNYWGATLVANRGGQLLALLLIVGGITQLVFLGQPQGLWVVAVGGFLAMAANASHKQFKLRRRLQGYHARDLMDLTSPSIPAGTTLETLVKEYPVPNRNQIYLVTKAENLLGFITQRTIAQVPQAMWPTTKVEQAMRSANHVPSVEPDAEAYQAMELMEEEGSPIVCILDRERVSGFITQGGALHILARRNTGP